MTTKIIHYRPINVWHIISLPYIDKKLLPFEIAHGLYNDPVEYYMFI